MVPESSEFGAELRLRDYIVVVATALAGLGAFVAASALVFHVGYPLDDSWIHETYARNLAANGEWAFQLGRPSAGSTSPLWTFLLSPGYLLGLGPPWWSHILSLLLLAALGITAESTARRLRTSYRPRLPYAAILVVLEWHIIWAAASGMETLLHSVVVLAVLGMVASSSRQFARLGLLTGLSVWIRPDGLTLVGPVLLWLLAGKHGLSLTRGLAAYVLGLGALLAPYLVFNLWLSGTPLPNTFYAKQAEYVAWQARSIPYRLGIGILQLSAGPLLVLWPGVAISVRRAFTSRNIGLAAALIWCMLYPMIYLVRLPAYQHGRYLIPVIPVVILVGFLGLTEFLEQSGSSRRRWAFAWRSGLAIATASFAFLGARAYGKDVAAIETEMVTTAHWIANNLPPDAVIAAHDIGALGFFDRHELIDLAGLVSPEVIPIIRDQHELAALLDSRGVQFLVAFPEQYPQLAAVSLPVYSSGGKFAPAVGQGNMTVYCWRCR